MTATVACTLDLPDLAEAAAARGLRLVPFRAGVEAQAAVFDTRGGAADGVEQVRRLGWRGPLLLVVPAGGSVADALDAGADDAVVAPGCAAEIAARLAARLRRPPSVAFTIGALSIDAVARRVDRAGRAIRLSEREFALLLHLARAGGRCVSRAELLAMVWGIGFDPGTNVVEVHMSRLRAKLDRDMGPPMLRTEKGRGYALVSGS